MPRVWHRFLCWGLLAWLAVPPAVRGDGGDVRLSEQAGGYRITVFSAPSPLRAGPVDLSVLVQDVTTSEPLPDACVVFRLASANGVMLEQPATREAATNKLLAAAKFELPAAGAWRVEVQIDGPRGPAEAAFDLAAAAPLPRWTELWAWVALPFPLIGLFVLHQMTWGRKKVSRR